MKHGILAYYNHFGNPNTINIGDYVQSLAQEMFLGKADYFVPREDIKNFTAQEEVLMILNGWFKDYPEDFPPNSCIKPLFVSFHTFSRNAEKLLTPSVVEYLKKHSPIGCRDKFTENLLREKGVDAYFSGCLTLTLGEKYKTSQKTDKIYFVDLPYCRQKISRYIKMATKIPSVLKLCKIWKEQKFYQKIFLKRLRRVLNFYALYSEYFSDDILLNAEYICHDVHSEIFKNEQEKLSYAEQLVKKYASAKLVVTSRIHCALPCVGMNTPVIFVTDKKGKIVASGRTEGLVNLFDKVACATRNGLCFKEHKKESYIPLKNTLIERVKNFIQQEDK